MFKGYGAFLTLRQSTDRALSTRKGEYLPGTFCSHCKRLFSMAVQGVWLSTCFWKMRGRSTTLRISGGGMTMCSAQLRVEGQGQKRWTLCECNGGLGKGQALSETVNHPLVLSAVFCGCLFLHATPWFFDLHHRFGILEGLMELQLEFKIRQIDKSSLDYKNVGRFV